MNTLSITRQFTALCVILILSLLSFFRYLKIDNSLVYVLVLSLVVFFILQWQVFKISRESFSIFSIIAGIAFIDKGNDLISSGSLIYTIPLMYALLVTYFLLVIKKEYYHLVWRYIFLGLLFSLTFIVIADFAKLSDYGKHLEIYLYIIAIYLFYTHNLWIIPVVIILLFCYFVLGARAGTLSIIIFLILTFIFRRIKRRYIINTLLVLYLCAVVSILVFAIQYEVVGLRFKSEVLHGRGWLWFKLISETVNHNVFFGCPSDPNFLNNTFTATFTNDMVFANYYERILKGVHAHNGIVYIFYNSGLIGISLFIVLIFACFKRLEYNYKNIAIFLGALFNYTFIGRTFYGIDLPGFVILVSLLVPFDIPERRIRFVIKHAEP